MNQERNNGGGDIPRSFSEQITPQATKHSHRYITNADRWKLRGVTAIVVTVSTLIIVIWGYGAWSSSRDMLGRPIPELDMFRKASSEIGTILGEANRAELDDFGSALSILETLDTVPGSEETSTTVSSSDHVRDSLDERAELTEPSTTIISTSTEPSSYGN